MQASGRSPKTIVTSPDVARAARRKLRCEAQWKLKRVGPRVASSRAALHAALTFSAPLISILPDQYGYFCRCRPAANFRILRLAGCLLLPSRGQKGVLPRALPCQLTAPRRTGRGAVLFLGGRHHEGGLTTAFRLLPSGFICLARGRWRRPAGLILPAPPPTPNPVSLSAEMPLSAGAAADTVRPTLGPGGCASAWLTGPAGKSSGFLPIGTQGQVCSVPREAVPPGAAAYRVAHDTNIDCRRS
jgi:hypothetical protein